MDDFFSYITAKKIMILGNFGVSNIGDELILESTIKKIKDKDLVITCPFPKVIQKKWKIKSINLPPLGIRSSFKIWRWFIFINELRKSEILLVAGGGLLRDGYSFWLWSVPLWLAILLRKSIYWQSADFTGVKKPINKKLLSFILKKSKLTTVRDDHSLSICHQLDIKEAIKTLDPVFLLPWDAKNKRNKVILSPKSKFSDIKIWNEVYNILKKKGYEVVWFACQKGGLEDDFRFLSKFNKKVSTASSYSETQSIFADAKLVITARLHAGIIGKILNCDVIFIPSAEKIKAMSKDLDCLLVSEKNLIHIVEEI